MVDSDVLSLAGNFPEELSAFVCWRHPSRDVQIYLRPESVQRLSAGSLRRSKSQRPSELGGLLWGKRLRSEQNGSALVLIPQFVPSETLLYNTTEKDFRQLIEARNHPAQDGACLLGFFRSHLREGLCLGDQDSAFITQYITDPDSVFLIIRPFEIGICMAGFFFGEHGRLQTDVSDLEVPFVAPDGGGAADEPEPVRNSVIEVSAGETLAGEMAGGPPREKREVPAASAVAPSAPGRPQPAQQTRSRPPRATPARRGRRNPFSPKFLLPAAAVLLICLGVSFVAIRLGFRLMPAPTAAAKTEVGLQVKVDSNGQMDLSWDQASPDLQKALGAKLTIVDGTLHRELNVDRTQLRFGKLAYFPNSDDVQFYLEIHLDAERSIAESVRVLPRLGREPTAAQGPAGAAHPPTTKARALPIGDDRPLSSAAQSASSRISLPADEPVRSFPVELARSAAFLQALRLTPAKPMTAPPAIEVATDEPAASLRVIPEPVPPPLPTRPPQASPSSDPPVTPGPVYVPARPLKQVLPTVPVGPSLAIYEAASVTLQLEINEKGRVTGVHVKEGSSGTNALLTAQAVAAARQWKFQPALLHGKNVRSEHTIVFRFRPGE